MPDQNLSHEANIVIYTGTHLSGLHGFVEREKF